MSRKDLLCGWCHSIGRCVTWVECPGFLEDPSRWTSMTHPKETKITSVKPRQLQKTAARYLDIDVEGMTRTSGQFYCEFSTESCDEVLVTSARLTAKSVRCASPNTSSLAELAKGKHETIVKLSIKLELASTNFTFFDCASYNSCTECVASKYPCDWCMNGHRCTHDHKEYCRNDSIVTKEHVEGRRSEQRSCPAIFPDATKNILLPSGVEQVIKFRIRLHALLIVISKFACEFQIEDRVIRVKGELLDDIVFCRTELSYEGDAPTLIMPVTATWDREKPIDNPENVHIVLYRCENMADDCASCAYLEKKYNCGWCPRSDKCTVQQECNNETSVETATVTV